MKQNIICTVIMTLFLATALPEYAFAAGSRDSGVTTLTIAGRDGAFGEAMRLATEEYTFSPTVDPGMRSLTGTEAESMLASGRFWGSSTGSEWEFVFPTGRRYLNWRKLVTFTWNKVDISPYFTGTAW